MYSYVDIQKMIETVNSFPDNKFLIYVKEHTNPYDARAIEQVLDDGYYEEFDRFDSDVCEQFIQFFETYSATLEKGEVER